MVRRLALLALLSLFIALGIALGAACAPSKEARSAERSGSAPRAISFEARPGWVVETPSSSMRRAQFRLPRADGDAEDASLVVYFFGGQGGSVEANLERWAGQFEQPDGASSAERLRKETRTVHGTTVTEVDLSGTYVAETSPGSGERVRKEGWRMLAAILETREGPFYVKLVGPRSTVERWEASYREFLSASVPAP